MGTLANSEDQDEMPHYQHKVSTVFYLTKSIFREIIREMNTTLFWKL